MAEALFYHLTRQTLEQALPGLLERSLARGWRCVVQASSQERLQALDDGLWTWRDDSFLPHAQSDAGDAALQPILLTLDDANPNGAQARFLVDGAALPLDAASYARVILMFDGRDEEAVAAARAQWTAAKAAGLAATYWRQDDAGRWTKAA